MLEAKNILSKASIWQYIVFKYNEIHQRQARKMAKETWFTFCYYEVI